VPARFRLRPAGYAETSPRAARTARRSAAGKSRRNPKSSGRTGGHSATSIACGNAPHGIAQVFNPSQRSRCTAKHMPVVSETRRAFLGPRRAFPAFATGRGVSDWGFLRSSGEKYPNEIPAKPKDAASGGGTVPRDSPDFRLRPSAVALRAMADRLGFGGQVVGTYPGAFKAPFSHGSPPHFVARQYRRRCAPARMRVCGETPG